MHTYTTILQPSSLSTSPHTHTHHTHADMMKTELPAPGPDTLVLRCGPTPMMEVMKRVLGELGHEDSAQFQF